MSPKQSLSHYQIWQQTLLNEMGVTVWTKQQQPIITLDNHQHILENLTSIDSNASALTNPPSHINHLTENINSDASATHDEHDEIVVNATSDIIDMTTLITIDEEAKPASTPQTEPDTALLQIIPRFSLQAIVMKQWILLADTAVLQEDNQQLLLWQRLAHACQSKQHHFGFPLWEETSQFKSSTISIETMSSAILAMASFAGFFCALSNQQPKHLGAVTSMPESFTNLSLPTPLQYLPQLTEMLDNPEKKRQLWQLIND